VDHPGLADPAAPEAGAVSRAQALLDQRLLLPILDGLDELPEAAWSGAIDRINEWLPPRQGLVLASRTQAYRHVVTPSDPATSLPVPLRGAAGISLRPLAPDDVRAYLRRDAGSPAAAARWDLVLATLGGSAPVAQALTTPLLVGLARTIYNPRPGEHTGRLPDPAELCDATWFPTRAAIQEHLFDVFIPAAYRPHADARHASRWTADQAKRWLAFLATRMHHDRSDTIDIAWWQLHRTIPTLMLRLVFALVVGLAIGLADARMEALGHRVWDGRLVGLGAGLMVALNLELSRQATPAKGLRWSKDMIVEMLKPMLWIVVLALVAGKRNRLVGGLIGLGFGLGFGLVATLPIVGVFGLEGAPADLTTAADPRTVLARDRRALLAAGLAGGLGPGIVAGLYLGLWFGLAAGLLVGLAIGLYRAAWGWFAAARCWLTLRRRLPWRLMTFLADAHRRGVLRQAGAVYQFRHLELQRRLATRPR
jgi:hypothetical protein